MTDSVCFADPGDENDHLPTLASLEGIAADPPLGKPSEDAIGELRSEWDQHLLAEVRRAETERDAALDEARMMQDRLTRLVEGSKAQNAELVALRPVFAAAQRMVSGPYEMTDHAGNILVDPREYQALAQAVAHASRRS